jgi:hypothetical protein
MTIREKIKTTVDKWKLPFISGVSLVVVLYILIFWVLPLFGLSGGTVSEGYARSLLTGTDWMHTYGAPITVTLNHTVDRACEGAIYAYDLQDRGGAWHKASVDLDIGPDCLPNEIGFYGQHDWRRIEIDGNIVYSYGYSSEPFNILDWAIPVAGIIIIILAIGILILFIPSGPMPPGGNRP